MPKAASSYRPPRIANRIIWVFGTLCVTLLMAGLIVQTRLMRTQMVFYETALAYCTTYDCSDVEGEELVDATGTTTTDEDQADEEDEEVSEDSDDETTDDAGEDL